MKNFLKQINPFNNIKVENKWLFLIKTILKFAFVYLLNLAVIFLIGGIIKLLVPKVTFLKLHLNEERLKLIGYYLHFISIVITLIMVKAIDKESYQSVGLVKRKWWQVLIGFGVALLVGIIVVLVLVFSKQLKFNGINKNWNPIKGILFLGAFFVYAIAEELLCRGLIENRIRKKFNIHICVTVAFLAFCVPHFVELVSELFSGKAKYAIVSILNLLLISYCFSLFLDEFDNIFVCSGFHTGWNFLLYSVIGSRVNGIKSETSIFSFTVKSSIFSGGAEGLEAGLVASVLLFILCVILTIFVKRKEKREHLLEQNTL